MRRDGKDTKVVAKVIEREYLAKRDLMDHPDFIHHMHAYASAAWVLILSTIDYFLRILYSRPRWSQFTN